ncbi:CDK6 [Acanthosepion pharaonis]|uniref:CDK6 n=1 Tax=Acanthosepion pharaonis TaxID=158019 RepID=A0A812EWH5_ACAPH|nr:CDK6 [Sepia pharaonis]
MSIDIYLCLLTSIYLSISLSAHIYLSIYLCLLTSIYLSPHIYLSLFTSIYLSVCSHLSISLSAHIYLSLSAHIYLSIYLSVCKQQSEFSSLFGGMGECFFPLILSLFFLSLSVHVIFSFFHFLFWIFFCFHSGLISPFIHYLFFFFILFYLFLFSHCSPFLTVFFLSSFPSFSLFPSLSFFLFSPLSLFFHFSPSLFYSLLLSFADSSLCVHYTFFFILFFFPPFFLLFLCSLSTLVALHQLFSFIHVFLSLTFSSSFSSLLYFFTHLLSTVFLDVNLRVLEGETRMTLVFEYIDQDLATYLEQHPSKSLGQEKIRDLMAQLLSGIEFLHCHKVVHRDLKPQNILVTRNGLLKIADFGLARLYAFQMTLTAVVVTLWYRAPEVILQAQYATPVDMWSCGCIFAELFNRRPLFRGQSEIDQLVKIFDVLGLPPREEWPDNAFLPRNSFQSLLRRPLEEYVQGISPLAKDLLLVSIFLSHFVWSAASLKPAD